MKTKLSTLITVGLLISILLTSCNRNRLSSQTSQPYVNESNQPAATRQAPQINLAPTTQPTDAGPAVQPTFAQPTAASPEISQTADDLSTMIDAITKDLDGTDTMKDVK